MNVSAIPVSARKVGSDPDAVAIGTAFFAATHNQIFMVTAAHVPIKAPPHSDWARWPRQLHLSPETRTLFALDLFDQNGLPKFIFRMDQTGMADFMALPVAPSAFLNGGIFARYVVFNLIQLAEPHLGLPVIMAGYPHVEDRWPYDPAQLHVGSILSADAGLVEVDAIPIEGFSGGPAIALGGRLVGMTIGSESGRGRIVRASWMQEQLI